MTKCHTGQDLHTFVERETLEEDDAIAISLNNFVSGYYEKNGMDLKNSPPCLPFRFKSER